MTKEKRRQAEKIYLILSGLFITSLVTSNLIFQKFFIWSPFGLYDLELSVGIIAYPFTFLVTDIISEVYGKKRANQLVKAGIYASAFALLIVIVSTSAKATDWSPINDVEFRKVFGMLLLNGYIFKVLFALLDTPVVYAVVYFMRKYFHLEGPGAEIDF